MVLRREGTPQDAASFLSEVFDRTAQHLDAFQALTSFAEAANTGQTAKQMGNARGLGNGGVRTDTSLCLTLSLKSSSWRAEMLLFARQPCQMAGQCLCDELWHGKGACSMLYISLTGHC